MLEDSSYADSVILNALSHLWGVRITVLDATTLQEQRFRHNEDMERADIVLVYNGVNHYSGAGMYTQLYIPWQSRYVPILW